MNVGDSREALPFLLWWANGQPLPPYVPQLYA